MTIRAPKGGEKDEVYYWDTVRFLVEGTVFKLPRYQFIVGSEYFAQTYLRDNTVCPTPPLDGNVDEDWDSMDVTDAPRLRISTAGAIQLECVTAAEFRVFLKLLFPMHSTSTTLTLTKPEWLTILTLSTRWHFLEFRKLAIAHLDPQMTDPVEMIVVGRREFLPSWVLQGYESLVVRKEAISEEESDVVGDRTAVRLFIVKHELAARIACDRGAVEGGSGDGEWLRGRVHERFGEEFEVLEKEERSRKVKHELEQQEVSGETEGSPQGLPRGEVGGAEEAPTVEPDMCDARLKKQRRKKAKGAKGDVASPTQEEVGPGPGEPEGDDSAKVPVLAVVNGAEQELTPPTGTNPGGREVEEDALSEGQLQALQQIQQSVETMRQLVESEAFKQAQIDWGNATNSYLKSTRELIEEMRIRREGS